MDSPVSSSAESHERRSEEIAADLRRGFQEFLHSLWLVWESFRFVLFFVYVVLAVVALWFWLLTGLVLLIRGVLRVIMTAILWLSQGTSPGPGGRPRHLGEAMVESLRTQWRRRHLFYADVARPVARAIYDVHRAAIRFWHFSFPRKLLVAIMMFFFVVLPASYVVPRPHYVQITDDNAVNYYENGTKVVYLIHGLDLFDPGHTREYQNENAPWLGKFNAQGLKNKLVIGRYYKMWIVGLRWYIPQLYPNIISVTETDRNGVPLGSPSHFVPATTTGR